MTATSVSGLLLWLALLPVADCDLEVFGTVGNSVTLPCKYNVSIHGLVPICWGRGDIPNSKCSNQLISADGATVNEESSRYRLLGHLEKGDVSMTILNLSEKDSGKYGCRVEIYGIFNDLKNHIILRVQKANEPNPNPNRTLNNMTVTENTPLNYTQESSINSTWYTNTSEPENLAVQETTSFALNVWPVCLLGFASVAVVVVAVYFIKRSGKFSKYPQIASLSGIGPNNREENIYQMDEVNEYQYSP